MLAWKKNQNNQFSTLPGLKKVIIIIIIIKKKKGNQPYMLKCGHVKKRRRVYALEKKDTEYKVKYELTMHVYSKKHTTFSVFCNNI